jgi:hypothetical protein
MQLSLIDDLPTFNKEYFLDIFAEATFVGKGHKMRLYTIEGQQIPEKMCITINSKFISKFPEGTIFKLDTKLVRKEGKEPYFIARKGRKLDCALEYYEYNLKLQNGFGIRMN